jgi:NADH-quinone oxidoreductase subunit G
LAPADEPGRDAAEIAAALGDELTTVMLFQADPVRTHPDQPGWRAALERATSVIGFSDFVTQSLAEHATVVFPAESYAEKEGTVTHPDGRVQRVRQAIPRPGEVRSQVDVLLELMGRLTGSPLQLGGSDVFAQMTSAIPFYGELTLEEIGGRGVRWQDRAEAGRLPQSPLPSLELEQPPEPPATMRLGTVPSLWTGRETDHAPSLRFLAPSQRVELSERDARELGVAHGDEVEVASDGRSVRGVAVLRAAQPAGSVFLTEGTSEQNATALVNGKPTTVELRKS